MIEGRLWPPRADSAPKRGRRGNDRALARAAVPLRNVEYDSPPDDSKPEGNWRSWTPFASWKIIPAPKWVATAGARSAPNGPRIPSWKVPPPSEWVSSIGQRHQVATRVAQCVGGRRSCQRRRANGGRGGLRACDAVFTPMKHSIFDFEKMPLLDF